MGEKKKDAAKNTIRIGLTDEDASFIERQKQAVIDTRCEVFRCLKIVVLLNQDSEFLSEDEKQLIAALADKWGRQYAPQLGPKRQSLKECQSGVAERVTQQVEELLSEYLPACQFEVLKKLQDRLPVRER